MKTRLGNLIRNHRRGGQDAVHVACVAASCGEPLKPGQRVRFINDDLDCVEPANSKHNDESMEAHLLAHGIVDPFLPMDIIDPGQQFWVCLFPGGAGEMTHRFVADISSIEEGVQDQMHEDWCSGEGC